MAYRLHITAKNYSSWSLRAWSLMRGSGIPFEEVVHPLKAYGQCGFDAFSPNGRVPCLHDCGRVVWDSLAIAEYLAERHPGVWPADAAARAWARCACAEMHSGFTTLRNQHGMSVGVRVAVPTRSPALLADIARVEALWNDGLGRFGGPFLAGAEFTAADAFFAPVAYRFRTYGIAPSGPAAAYLTHLLAHPALLEWERDALAEDFREAEHEAEIAQAGEVTADYRVPARN